MGMASHFKTIAYTDTSPVFSRSLRRRDAWTNGDMHAIRRLPHQLFEGVGACTFLHSNRLSSCCRRGKYPHSTEPVPTCLVILLSTIRSATGRLALNRPVGIPTMQAFRLILLTRFWLRRAYTGQRVLLIPGMEAVPLPQLQLHWAIVHMAMISIQ